MGVQRHSHAHAHAHTERENMGGQAEQNTGCVWGFVVVHLSREKPTAGWGKRGALYFVCTYHGQAHRPGFCYKLAGDACRVKLLDAFGSVSPFFSHRLAWSEEKLAAFAARSALPISSLSCPPAAALSIASSSVCTAFSCGASKNRHQHHYQHDTQQLV